MSEQRSNVGSEAVPWMSAMAKAPVLLLVCVSVAMLVGCASPASDRHATKAITIERVDSSRAQVRSARVTRRAAEITVSGRLKKRYHGRSPIPGHLHIEAFDAEGELLAETTTRYRRQSPKTGWSYYSQSLPVDGDRVRTIRVAHHEDHGSDDA